jgi:hypothetical protein
MKIPTIIETMKEHFAWFSEEEYSNMASLALSVVKKHNLSNVDFRKAESYPNYIDAAREVCTLRNNHTLTALA